MSYAFNIPGYVQGHRFLDDPQYYDATEQRFKDLAGFDHLGNGLRITAGSPVFETVGAHRGIRLNNTFHGSFKSPIPWMGSVILVIKPTYVSGSTLVRSPYIFGDFTTINSNGVIQIVHFSGSRRVAFATGSVVLSMDRQRNDNNLVVVAFALDQQTQKAYATVDGVTVAESAAAAGTTTGSAAAISGGLSGVRFGNLNNIVGDLTELSDFYCGVYEHHFFSGNILTESLPATAAFMARLRTKYGVV